MDGFDVSERNVEDMTRYVMNENEFISLKVLFEVRYTRFPVFDFSFETIKKTNFLSIYYFVKFLCSQCVHIVRHCTFRRFMLVTRILCTKLS